MDIQEQINYLNDHYDCWAIPEYRNIADTMTKMHAVVGAAKLITGEHDSDCDTVVRASEATNRWFPECDCKMSELHETLAALEGSK